MRTLAVLGFVSFYRCAESANNGGSMFDPSTWTEAEFMWLPFNLVIVGLVLFGVFWSIDRRKKGLPLFSEVSPQEEGSLRDELRRHRRFDRHR
jgi:hypothetical protein